MHANPVVAPGIAHDTALLTMAIVQASVSRHEAESSLWTRTDQLRGHRLEIASRIEMGDPADVILAQAEKLTVDLLSMGRPPPPPVERWLLTRGSVFPRTPACASTCARRATRCGHLVRVSRLGVLITLDGSALAERALNGLAEQRQTATATHYVEDVAVALNVECIGKIHTLPT